MVESDYIDVQNLTRIRVASDMIRNVLCTSSEETLKRLNVLNLLIDMERRLKARIIAPVVPDEKD